MTPEIRAAVKTLAAAFQTILEALAKEETPKPRAPAAKGREKFPPLPPEEEPLLPPPRTIAYIPNVADYLRGGPGLGGRR
jgi:hypothetical protein